MPSLYESHTTGNDAEPTSETEGSEAFTQDLDNVGYVLFTDLTNYTGQKVGKSSHITTDTDSEDKISNPEDSPLLNEYLTLKGVKSSWGSRAHKPEDAMGQPAFREAVGVGNLDLDLASEAMSEQFGIDVEIVDFVEAEDYTPRKGNDPVYLPVFSGDIEGTYEAPAVLGEGVSAPEGEDSSGKKDNEPSLQEQAADLKREKGWSHARIAEELDCHTSTVSKGCKEYLTSEEREELIGGTPKGEETPDTEPEGSDTEGDGDMNVNDRADAAIRMMEAGFTSEEITQILG